jgi:hypothetical protein
MYSLPMAKFPSGASGVMVVTTLGAVQDHRKKNRMGKR